MSSSDFANVYASINNLQNQFNSFTGNILSNYNQLNRIISQQGNINTSLNGSGNILTGNLFVNGNANISGNTTISGNIISNGFSTFTSQTPLQIVTGTAVIGVVPTLGIKFTGNITFGRTFRNVPKITVTSSAGTNTASVSYLVANKTTTQFDLWAYNSWSANTSSDSAIDFIAIG